MLANPDPADWLMLSRTFDQNRFSPLNQINKDNVGQLRMAWTRGLPAGTQETTPIVYRGVMYLYVPGGNVQAINATNGDLIWEYVRDYPKNINPRASRHKNLGIFEDMIYFGAPDGFLVALDAKTGKVRWETKVDDGHITAGGILVADGKVLTNRTCMQGCANPASSRRTMPAPARRSGNSTPPRRRASRVATPGATCRSRSAPPARGGCRVLRSEAPNHLLGHRQSRIPTPG